QYSGIGVSGSGVGGYGNVVVIKDSNGYIHVYAHLDSVNVKKGQNISKGDMIGRQGATGQVTGSHLHYEIRKPSNVSLGWTSKQETSTVDPTKYLNGADNRMLEILIIDGKRGKKQSNVGNSFWVHLLMVNFQNLVQLLKHGKHS